MKLNFDPQANISKTRHILAKLNLIHMKINGLLVVKGIVSNWYDVLLFRIGLKKSFVMKLRDGNTVNVMSKNDYFNLWNTAEAMKSQIEQIKQKNPYYKIKIDAGRVNFTFNNKKIALYYDSEKQLSNTVGLIHEQFILEQYKWLNVKDKDVVDIGANIGDSAIYFAVKGAKHVYAFEPYPYSYNLAKRNIAENKLEKVVTILNKGIGPNPLKIKIKADYKNSGSTDLKSFDSGEEIKIMTLEDIVKQYRIDNGILKIDCEGCEYGIVLNAKKETLKKFDQIMIEYHYGYKNLVRKLKEAGFHVKITVPQFYFNSDAKNHNMVLGLIYAKLEAV
ncbi:MAG: FkbM family methyltransferase [Candidatus Micrarchaeaceae archaeon]